MECTRKLLAHLMLNHTSCMWTHILHGACVCTKAHHWRCEWNNHLHPTKWIVDTLDIPLTIQFTTRMFFMSMCTHAIVHKQAPSYYRLFIPVLFVASLQYVPYCLNKVMFLAFFFLSFFYLGYPSMVAYKDLSKKWCWNYTNSPYFLFIILIVVSSTWVREKNTSIILVAKLQSAHKFTTLDKVFLCS